jgi:hypothetical protein
VVTVCLISRFAFCSDLQDEVFFYYFNLGFDSFYLFSKVLCTRITKSSDLRSPVCLSFSL